MWKVWDFKFQHFRQPEAKSNTTLLKGWEQSHKNGLFLTKWFRRHFQRSKKPNTTFPNGQKAKICTKYRKHWKNYVMSLVADRFGSFEFRICICYVFFRQAQLKKFKTSIQIDQLSTKVFNILGRTGHFWQYWFWLHILLFRVVFSCCRG